MLNFISDAKQKRSDFWEKEKNMQKILRSTAKKKKKILSCQCSQNIPIPKNIKLKKKITNFCWVLFKLHPKRKATNLMLFLLVTVAKKKQENTEIYIYILSFKSTLYYFKRFEQSTLLFIYHLNVPCEKKTYTVLLTKFKHLVNSYQVTLLIFMIY